MATTVEKPERETIRVSLDLTPEMKEVIEDLARRDGTSQAVMLRKALGVLKTLKDAQDEGMTPALIDPKSGNVSRLIGI